MKATVLVAILLVLTASPVLAGDEKDPETRFHEAYLTEVVHGNVSMAALVYLDLADDDAVEPALRAESRFRFAVCCVLLGRADEARAKLAEVLEDRSAPAALKRRAKEYRSSLEGLAAGSVLDKRLQALAFELGRVEIGGKTRVVTPATYRDFQIIGEPAVPFLKELLGHPDRILRQHAFRILLRMDVPGMAELWNPERFPAWAVTRDMTSYVGRNETEMRRYEEIIRPLPGKEVNRRSRPLLEAEGWSLSLIEEIGTKEDCAELASRMAFGAPVSDEKQSLIEDWLTGDDPELARQTAIRLTHATGAESVREFCARPGLLRTVTRLFVGHETSWRPRHARGRRLGDTTPRESGFQSLARLRPHAELLALLEWLVSSGESWDGEPRMSPLVTGLADGIAHGLDREGATPDERARYHRLVSRWMAVRETKEYVKLPGQNRPVFPDEPFREHVLFLLRNLPPEEAGELAGAYLEWSRIRSAAWLLQDWKVTRAGDVRIVKGAMRSAPKNTQGQLLGHLRLDGGGSPEERADIAAEIIASLPEFGRILQDDHLCVLMQFVPAVALRVEPEAAVKAITALGPRFSKAEAKWQGGLLATLLSSSSTGQPDDVAFRRLVAVPALQPLWEASDAALRPIVVREAAGFLFKHEQGSVPLGGSLPILGEFLTAHVTEIPSSYHSQLAKFPELVPIELWIPLGTHRYQGGRLFAENLEPAEADRAARKLAEKPRQVNEGVLAFIKVFCSPEAKAETLGSYLAGTEGEALRIVLGNLDLRTGSPARIEDVEKTLTRLLEKEKPDLASVARVTRILAAAKPTTALFPAAELLLGSGDKEAIKVGASVAQSLGRTELLKPLAANLTSMDPEIRNAAKSAMDSIQELEKLRDEEKLREAGRIR